MNFSTSPVTIDETQKIMKQMTNCICKINTGRIYGTAFFCKVRFVDNSSLNVLMTSYSLIDENYLKENKEINLLLNDNSTKIIILDKKRKIYTDKNYNLTLIELRNKDNINDFFHIDDYLLLSEEKHKNFYENKQIYILHYLNMGKPSVSYGFLTELNDSEIKHTCLIKSGSLGSPILNFANNKIIGISKEQNDNLNLGTFLRLPIKEFKNLIDNPKKAQLINNLKEKSINNSILKSITSNNNNIYLEENNKEKPKMMIVFKTVKVSYPMTVDFGTSIRELLKQFLKKVKRKKDIDIGDTKIGFLFNSVRLNKNEKALKDVVEKYFNNRRFPTIIVTHL